MKQLPNIACIRVQWMRLQWEPKLKRRKASYIHPWGGSLAFSYTIEVLGEILGLVMKCQNYEGIGHKKRKRASRMDLDLRYNLYSITMLFGSTFLKHGGSLYV